MIPVGTENEVENRQSQQYLQAIPHVQFDHVEPELQRKPELASLVPRPFIQYVYRFQYNARSVLGLVGSGTETLNEAKYESATNSSIVWATTK